MERLRLIIMKILKYEKVGNSKYRIYLDNGEVIDTYDEVILKDNLLFKSELSDSEYNRIFIETNLVNYYQMCVKYITVRIRSTKEIYDYLIRKKVSSSDIDVVIERLKRDKLLDDAHFAECFIKDKLNFTSMGEYKIVALLKQHNISSDIINEISYLWDFEVMLPRIEKIVDKQIASNKKLDRYKLRDKIYHYLINQGYSNSSVVHVLNQKF